MYPNPQDALPLPPNASLQQYEKLAQDLVNACKSGDREAIRAWAAEWLAALARSQDSVIEPKLPAWIQRQLDQVAKFAIIKLSNDDPSARCALADAQFVIASTHGFQSWPRFTKHIEALTHASSSISKFESAVDAIVSGDRAMLELLLQEDPELIRARSTRRHGATLLHYVSANGVEGYRQKSPKNAVEVVEVLLKAGAEVDAGAEMYGGEDATLELVATSIHPERAGVQIGLMEALLNHGATIDTGGRSAVNSCLANDRPQAAEFLAQQGARLDLEGAAGVGRLDVVTSFFDEDGSLKPNATKKQLQSGFIWACEYGRKDVVEFLLDKGVDLRAGENIGETALHLAAHRGQLEMIKLLLDRGAPLEAKNVYGGTVLGQATWSVMHGDPSIARVPVIEALLAAGARIEEADYPTGNAGVDDVLRRHGAK